VKRWVTALFFLVLIQVGIVAVMFWPERTSQQTTTEQLLPRFPVNAIDELRISDSFDNEVVLVRSGEQWLLPDRENLPADASKVQALLKDLTTQAGSWPVARSSAARQRFQVAAYHYQKRLTLFSVGEDLGTVYLGTSPGFRKVHARNADQNAIYSIPLNTFEAPASTATWLDSKLLQVRVPLRIDTDLYNLYFENGRWYSATGGRPDKTELDSLLSALKNLQVAGIANEDLQRDLAAAEDDLIMTIESLAGEVTLELIIFENQHYIHSSEFPLFFKLSAYDFDRLTGVDSRLLSGEDSSQ
jgi:hypothetical protein